MWALEPERFTPWQTRADTTSTDNGVSLRTKGRIVLVKLQDRLVSCVAVIATRLSNLTWSAMSNICQVTGRRPSTGFTISHSHRRNKRWFKPNIQKQRFYVPSEKRWVNLTVSAKGIKTINKKGIEAVLADMRRRGEKI